MIKQTDTHLFFFYGDDIYSNFYKRDFWFAGVKFFCMEQCMMWLKAMYFRDYQIAAEIMRVDPGSKIAQVECKSLGRKVANYDDTLWARDRYSIVVRALFEKFSQNPDMAKQLIATGSLELVEASPFDKIWGIGVGVDDPRIHTPTKWPGQNLLGKALMVIRDNTILTDLHKE